MTDSVRRARFCDKCHLKCRIFVFVGTVGVMGSYRDMEWTRWFRTSIVSSPYRAYIPDRINDWSPRLAPHARELVLRAESRIADMNQLKGELNGDTSITLLRLLTRIEGLATSSVENIKSTMRSMSLLESLRGRRRPETDRDARLALGSVHLNTAALRLAEQVAPPTVSDLEELHRVLFTDTAAQFDAGKLRTELVWVGGGHQTVLNAHYVPPPHTEVPALMSDLVACIADRTLWMPATAKAALVHTQFETIHPFTDGNGRLGRALTALVLRRDGHLRMPVPVSAAVSVRRDDYYSSLQAWRYVGDTDDMDRRSVAFEPAATLTADAVIVACGFTEAAAKSVDLWERRCREVSTKARASANSVLGVMRVHPAATLPFIVERSGLKQRTAERSLSRLVELGVLAESHDTESGVLVFEAPALLSIADNRDVLLNEAWNLHRHGHTDLGQRLQDIVEGNPDRQHLTSGSDGDESRDAEKCHATHEAAGRARDRKRAPRCAHIGSRSGKPCVRRIGHNGAHAY